MNVSQWIASLILQNVLSGKNLDKTFAVFFEKYSKKLEEINKPEIKNLVYGALRFLGESSFIINKLVKRRIDDNSLECLLYVALYQINHDRATDFTIVDQVVNACKKINSKKCGFINAILRNYLRDKVNLRSQAEHDEQANLNYPDWWVTKIKKEYPDNWIEILKSGNRHPSLTLRINQRKVSLQDYEQTLKEKGIDYLNLSKEALILKKPTDVQKIPNFIDGYVSIQDYGAQLAGHLIDLKKGHKVLDLCAAPGGKTCHMLELEQIELTAVDLNKKRVEMIKDNLGRADLKAKVINAKVDKSNEWWDGKQFDRIMLDAPCTASGIVRRHIDIKWLRRESDLEFFSNQQFELLDASWTMLKDKGKLLYVTCSIFREENRAVIEKFKKINNVEEIEIKFPKNIISIENQLIPNDIHDGLFYALLEK